jgi:glutamate-1-semialdehyde 2,1-aminomutase
MPDRLPYGAHTYSKCDARWFPGAPIIAKGKGGRCWTADGRELVDWTAGINNVLIGHAEDAIDRAAVTALRAGQAFGRPSVLEDQAAEAVLALFPHAEQIIFTKSGSSANDAAIRLARAVTGRQHIAFDGSAPFFSTADWWCSHQTKHGGTLDAERGFAHPFTFNHVDSLEAVFATRPLAAVILEAARGLKPTRAFVTAVNTLCQRHGTLLILDEVVTGYRYGLHGAAPVFGYRPDLFTLGKGMANGYSVAALLGKREYMRRGAADQDVFLLSTTNGAESSGLGAAIATAAFYREQDVVGELQRQGMALAALIERDASHIGIRATCSIGSRPVLSYPSDPVKVAFHQGLYEAGVLWAPNWVCPMFRHTDADMKATEQAIRHAASYARKVAA